MMSQQKRKSSELWQILLLLSVQFSSVPLSCLTLCDPMDCSMPVLPVHHQFPELTQTHVHRVSDTIQRSHPLSSPSPLSFPAPGSFPMSVLHIRWPKYWSFSFSISSSNEYSGLVSFRIDWLDFLRSIQNTLTFILLKLLFCLHPQGHCASLG